MQSSPLRPRPGLLLILLAGVMQSAVTAQFDPGDTRELGPESRDFDQIHLDLDLALDLDQGRLTASVTHTLRALADGLEVIRFHAVELQVQGVRVGETALKFESRDGLLFIRLNEPLRRGQQVTFTTDYTAQPRRGLYFFKPSDDYPSIPYQVWSQGEGTDNRHWIPCYDLPDDRLTSSLSVTVPARFQTLSNGHPLDVVELDGGKRRHRWVQEKPHVTYLITLVVGELEDIKSQAGAVELHYLVPPGWGEHAGLAFDRTPAMLEFFEGVTGFKYPWPRYSQVTVWDFMYGGMENTGATTLNMRALSRTDQSPDYSADGLIAHELVHQWYGDLITCGTFNHIWLNEGFATYFTDLWFEKAEGRDSFLVRRLESKRDYMQGVDLEKTAAGARPARYGECGDIAAHAYVKGSSVLHMLREILGEELWLRCIQEYTRTLADRSITSDDMRTVFEGVTGRDLGWFWDQWVFGSGFPVLSVRHSFDELTKTLIIDVDQVQPVTAAMPLFVLPVDLAWVDSAGKSTVRRVEVCRQHHRWRFACDEKPAFLRFDPDGTLAARLDERAPIEEWRAQLAGDRSVIGRVLAAEALAHLGDGAISALAQAAREDAGWEVRKAACEALGKIPADSAGELLIAVASSDADSRVRKAAVVALGARPAALVGQALTAIIANEKRDYVLAEAGFAVAQCKAPGAYDQLVKLLAHDSHRDIVRQRAADGLKVLGDARAVEHLLPYVDYKYGRGIQHASRHSALDALVALAPQDEQVRSSVASLCRDPYFRMRRWAIDHAVGLGLSAVSSLLADLARDDNDPGVRAAADRGAKRLLAPPPSVAAEPGNADATATEPPVRDAETDALEDLANRLELEAKIARLRAELRSLERQLEPDGAR